MSRGGAKNGLCASRRTQRARLALGGSSTTLGDGSAPSAPLQKVSADPYFNRTRFPPLFRLLRTRRSGAVLGSRDSVSAARVPLSGTDRRFPALCKKCRQTPILTLLVFLHTPRGGTARGGTLPRAGAQRPCCGGVEDGSTDAERPKEAGTGRVPRERAPTPLWI